MTLKVQEYSVITQQQVTFSGDRVFVFLDSDYFENSTSEVLDIEHHALVRLLWEDNPLWDEYKHDGPIVVEIPHQSPLINHFINHWAPQNRGIIMLSRFSQNQVFQHLQSLTFVSEPDNTLSRLRLYEPRKLRGIIDAMGKDIQQLMGPVEKLIWQENCGNHSVWLEVENTDAFPPGYTIKDEHWFAFSEKQNAIINKHEEKYFSDHLSWQLGTQFNLPVDEASRQASALIKEAKTKGFYKEVDIETYAKLRMKYGDFGRDRTILSHLSNTDFEPGGRLTKIKTYLENKSVDGSQK